jgi:hypothetical protein
MAHPVEITVDLHGLPLTFLTADPALADRFALIFGHLPRAAQSADGLTVTWAIHPGPEAPLPPPHVPALAQTGPVNYFGKADEVFIRLPRYGLLTVDMPQRRVDGLVTARTLTAYGAFEDTLMIALAPLYRRRGWFPLHAFAALAPGGQAALITGQMGAGKTTTGLALLHAGWKLLSNDSPLLTLADHRVEALAYPGQLSAFDDSLARFDSLHRFIPATPEGPPQKRVFQVQAAFDRPWAVSGPVGAIFVPQVTPGLPQSRLERLSPKETLLALMPQAIDGWDKALISPTLNLLTRLAGQAPGYTLKLSPNVAQLPALVAGGLG